MGRNVKLYMLFLKKYCGPDYLFFRARIAKFIDVELINSICLPASCSPMQIVKFLNEDFQMLEGFSVVGGTCKEVQSRDSFEFSTIDIVTM